MATINEFAKKLEGRLAALELVAAKALHSAGTRLHGSAWPSHVGDELQKAITEMRQSLSGEGADAAEIALHKMFTRSQDWEAF